MSFLYTEKEKNTKGLFFHLCCVVRRPCYCFCGQDLQSGSKHWRMEITVGHANYDGSVNP